MNRGPHAGNDQYGSCPTNQQKTKKSERTRDCPHFNTSFCVFCYSILNLIIGNTLLLC
jgi:hypothetical protein